MELVEGGELFDHVVDAGSYSEPKARSVSRPYLERTDSRQYLNGPTSTHTLYSRAGDAPAPARPAAPAPAGDRAQGYQTGEHPLCVRTNRQLRDFVTLDGSSASSRFDIRYHTAFGCQSAERAWPRIVRQLGARIPRRA
jgi:hypothetical protein